MIVNPEAELGRRTATEAAPELVDPFKAVVRVAMSRVHVVGDVDELSRQRVALRYDVSRRAYLVSNVWVRKVWALGRSFVSEGDLDSGLFIEGIQLDEAGEPISRLTGIQIPRSPELVTQETLFLQRGSDPNAVYDLARELNNSHRIPQRKYNQLMETLRARELAAQPPIDPYTLIDPSS